MPENRNLKQEMDENTKEIGNKRTKNNLDIWDKNRMRGKNM